MRTLVRLPVCMKWLFLFVLAMEGLGFTNWRNSLVHIGTDGAAVYTGKRSGIVMRLKDSIEWLTGIHFVAHNIELAAGEYSAQKF